MLLQYGVQEKVLISCESEAQALEIDERLWQRDPNEFVPHNLSGEATQYPTPIEISWLGKRNLQRRDLLINLQQEIPDFSHSFTQIIDFVPKDDALKHKLENVINNYVCKVGIFLLKTWVNK